MVYILLFAVWMSTGDVQIATANFQDQKTCDLAAANVMAQLKVSVPDGVVAARAGCVALSDPVTERSAGR